MAMPVTREDKITPEDVESISVQSRIPKFWCDRPKLWFAQFEVIIYNQKLGDEGKFALVVAQLEIKDVDQISDIILSPPNSGRYEAVKRRLLEVYEDSEGIQLQKLLTDMELGDQRPSQLLRRMRNLAGKKIPDDTLKILWQGHLPASTRTVLAVSEESRLDSLAAMADRMQEQLKEVNAVCSCQCQSSTSKAPASATPAEIAATSEFAGQELFSMIKALTKEVAALKTNRSRKFQRRSHNFRSRSRSKSRDGRMTVCYFHKKFGKAAYRCRSPCSFKGTSSEKPEN